MEKTIYIYDSFSSDTDTLLGKLYVDVIRNGESYSFEFDSSWLETHDSSIIIDPALNPYTGMQFPLDSSLFGIFQDACPDRWGRTLMNRRERTLAIKEDRKPRKLYESDYLTGVDDYTRSGGLRFKLNPDGPFLNDDSSTSVPPWASLRTLEEASRNYENDKNIEKWLMQLLKPGSSLGGARPKATVIDTNGELWIAKFPSRNDESDTGAWEKVAYDLAKLCGLNTQESSLEKFSDFGSTFLIKRFDRIFNKRIHFSSAMTLLGKGDGASADDGSSYLEILDFIKTNGASPNTDTLELFKRIVFNMAISNTDDHLRNHAFIYGSSGWLLSPVYDINPVPYGNELSLLVDERDSRISFELAINTAHHFSLTKKQAEQIVDNIAVTVRDNWESLAKKYNISSSQMNDMRPAFDECYRYKK
ncbi:MAG: type II toxin-antitoxin system HipA family toxin [Erysipelotrichaceae bacterium]